MQMSPMPTKPREIVYADICGPFPPGGSVLVLTDGFSRSPEIEILHNTTAEALISHLDKIFATHGYPEELTKDNGPQFVSNTMATYLLNRGINIAKSALTGLEPMAK